MSERNPKYHPREGDIFKMPDGNFLLVDFQEVLMIAFTRSDGKTGSFQYYDSFTRMVESAEIVQFGSADNWPWNVPYETFKEHVARGPKPEEALKYLVEKTGPK